jgi:hypothetical protein
MITPSTASLALSVAENLIQLGNRTGLDRGLEWRHRQAPDSGAFAGIADPYFRSRLKQPPVSPT